MAGVGDTWDLFLNTLNRYGVAAKVEAIRGRFEEELPKLAEAGRVYDMVFLDGYHSFEVVSRDIELALPVLKTGGWFAFHDYGRGPHNGHPGFGVTEAADAFGIEDSVGFLGWGRK